MMKKIIVDAEVSEESGRLFLSFLRKNGKSISKNIDLCG